jgi:DNA helicase-2/ATP-dependent DNA helicase PcrA
VLAGLNPAQRDAVLATEGPLLVLAGAGTGKTRVITARIAHLLERGVDPFSILAVTFTNKAAGEMRERVTALVRRQGERRHGGHLPRLLREGAARARARARPRAALHDLRRLRPARDREVGDARAARARDGHAPERGARPHLARQEPAAVAESVLAEADGGRDQLVGSVWQRYREALARTRALDFDDLLLETVRLLRDHEPVREHYRGATATCWWTSTRTRTARSTRSCADRRRAPQRLRGGRRRPVDLRLARRRRAQDPRLRARLPRRQGACASRPTTARRSRSWTPPTR